MLEEHSPQVESYLMKSLSFTPAEIRTVRSSNHQNEK